MGLALRTFSLTLAIVLAIGIPAVFAIKSITDPGSLDDENSFSAKFEAIPQASVAPNVAVPDEEEDSIAEIVIDPEDEDYTYRITTTDPECVTLGFAGDILFDHNYAAGNAFRQHGNSPEGVIGESLLEMMKGADIMMANNEFPYSNRGIPTPEKAYTFRALPETASLLNDMGIDIVGLANNHAFDYGEEALVDSFEAIKNAGVVYTGAGRNIDEASHPVYYITENGMRIAIINATQIERLDNPDTKGATAESPGVFRCLDDTLLLERVRQAREKNAFVIVFIHWGTESTTEIDYLQTQQAKEIADAGANLIVGAHPHVLQKVDYVDGVPVIYSLGNYFFNSKTLDTCLMLTTIHRDGAVNIQMVPAVQSGCTLNEATGSEHTRILAELSTMSPGVKIDANGYISP